MLDTSALDTLHLSTNSELAEAIQSILELEQNSGWKVKLQKDDIVVSMINETNWSSTIPAVKSEFRLSTELTLAQFEALLNNPEIRMMWDKKAMTTFEIINTTAEYSD
jgi:hypothetical protein